MNPLHNALSPYLRQHATNPVHWRCWDAAALAEARRQDKPILLSIGYAACHWCHVMARESFADPVTAAQMNADFINIKVDREERPDIDRLYQTAHHIFTHRAGGWPLTMFLTPAGEPFYGGTYYPKHPRPGLPAFTDILARVTEAWRTRRADIATQNTHTTQILRAIDRHTPPSSAADALNDAPITAAARRLEDRFDDAHGGLGTAPKFPHPVELAFCLHIGHHRDHPTLLQKARRTLTKIATGGLRDHLGGGFFRYCTDAEWRIPHYEKMLNDNALLLSAYADTAALPPPPADDEDDRQTAATTAADIAKWTTATLRTQTGLYHTAQDADTAAGEGAYYQWDDSELRAALTPAEYTAFTAHHATADAPRAAGRFHIDRRQPIKKTAAATHLSAIDCESLIATAAAKLTRIRARRPSPAIDDKILTTSNALMVTALARAARLLPAASSSLAAAQQSFTALTSTLRRGARTRTAAQLSQNTLTEHGFLDDCAYLLAAALELLRTDFTAETLSAAQNLAAELCDHYEDPAEGGFYFTARDGERLLTHPKPLDDGAIPAGNGVAIRALLGLSQLTAESRWQKAAERALRLFYPTASKHPAACTSYLLALDFHLNPSATVYITGDPTIGRLWKKALDTRPTSSPITYLLPKNTTSLPSSLQKPAPQTGALAYWCDSKGCAPPVSDPADLPT